MTSDVVRRRQVAAQALLGLALVGMPTLIGVVGLLVVDRSWRAAVPGAAVAVVGAVCWAIVRRRPGLWSKWALYVGLAEVLAVFAVNLFAYDAAESKGPLVTAAGWLLPSAASVVGSWALALLGARVLTRPVVPDLADSRYEWSIPLRGVARTSLVVSTETVGVRRLARPVLEMIDLDHGHDVAAPMREVRMAWDATTSGSAPLNLPPEFAAESAELTGPAVGVQAGEHRWVLPVDDAGAVLELLRGRVAAAQQVG